MKDLKESNKNKDGKSLIRIHNKVGRGTYGTVFKAKGLKDNKFYAIKKFQNNDTKLQQQGFPITALRQITLLKQIDHPNIIKLKEIILSKPNKRNLYRGSTFLVFQYMDHDFAGLFKTKHKFTLPQIKCIIKQLLQGVNYLHNNKILHRDIKSANILLNDEGDVKLADFGLGRKVKLQLIFTYKVVTLWYRAPQLLWGCKTYSDRIDVWSLGCVVCQFFTGQVLFKKQTETAQIQKIYQICGDFQVNQIKIKQQDYKNYQYLNQMRPKKSYKKQLRSYLLSKCPNMTQITIDFIQGLLALDPSKRLSCDQALRHPFFNQKPNACSKHQIRKQQYECHEMFKDRSIKIQRIIKKQEENQSKKYPNYPNYPNNYNNRSKQYYQDRRPYYKNQKKSQSSPHKNSSSSMSSDYSSDDRRRRSSRQYNSKRHFKEDRKSRDYDPDMRKDKSYRNDYQDKNYKYEQKKTYKTERQNKEYYSSKYDDKYKKDERRIQQRKDIRKDIRRQDQRVERRSEDRYQSNDNYFNKYDQRNDKYDKYDKYQKDRYDSKGDYYKETRNNGDRNYLIDKEKDYKRKQQLNYKYDLKEKDKVYDKYQKYKNDFKGESRIDFKPGYRRQPSQKKGDKFIYTRNQRESSSSRSSYSSRNNRKERQSRKYGYERKGYYKKQLQSSPQRYH